MARTITDEDIKLNIIINGNPAQKQLLDLEKSTRKVTEENKQLQLELKRVEKSLGKNSTEYKELSDKIKANTTTIDNNKATMRELQKQIGITGLTMKQLGNEAALLRMKLANAVPGGEAYAKYKAELLQVENRLNELKGKAQAAKLSISSIADGFNEYQALAFSIIATMTGVVLSVQKIIDFNGKLSDAYANVMKTTRMTKAEVDELSKSFGLLKTRTQRIELLGIAAVAGELNIAKDEVFDFVKVMDKASVALGDSFEGGAEEVATKLGKIKNIYDELKDAKVETAFEAVGSALNELGADGNATAQNVADFVTRVGTMPSALKPSIREALGLGAAFEETGLNAEIAAGNYSKLLGIAARDFPKFAKIMKISADEAKKLMNTNPTEFFLKFAEATKDIKKGTSIARLLDDLKLNDQQVKQVLDSAAKNTDLFRQKIDLAGKSMNEATSLTDEFNVKNTNLAATLEKTKKTITGWFSSEGFNNWLFTMVSGFSKLIGATDDVDSSGQKWRNTLVFTAKVIAIVTSALITNVGWQKLVALWTTRNTEATLLYTIASKARAFADGISIVASQAYAGVLMLVRGNVIGATQAFRVMTATMMTTPWGFLLGAVAAIGTAYLMFSENAKEAATAQSMLADTSKQVDALVQKESSTFFTLMEVVQDLTASTEARSEALKKAKEIGGEYTKGLTLENAKTFEGKKMIDAYIESLEKKLKMQVLEGRIRKIQDEIEERKSKSLEEELEWYDKIWAALKSTTYGYGQESYALEIASNKKSKALKELQRQLNFTNAEMKEFLKANPDIIKTIDTNTETDYTGTPDAAGATKKNPNSSEAELYKLKLEEYSKFGEAYRRMMRQLEDDKIAIMQDGYMKDIAVEKLRYKRELEDIENQKLHAEQMAKLDEDIAKAKEAKDTTKHAALLEIKKYWIEKNKELDTLSQNLAEGKLDIHRKKILTINEKRAADEFKKKEEQYNREKLLRETDYNLQLAALGDNEGARAALKKKYEKEELEAQRKFLTDLLKEQQQIIGGQNGKIQWNLLSDEEKQKLIDSLNETINKLSELGIKIEEINAKKFDILQGQGTDIFGFSPEQWDSAFSHLDTAAGRIKALETVIGGLQNAYGMYANFVAAKEANEMKSFDRNQTIQRNKLKKQLDGKILSQSQYDKAMERLEVEKEKRLAEQEYKQAKRERLQALLTIAINTGIGVMKAVAASPLNGGLPWSAIIAGMGIAQAALIPPLPAKGYEDGLYPDYVKREQDGKVFKSTGTSKMQSGLFSKPRILVGEGPGDMPEMVIDKRAYSQISPATKNALLNELRGIKGFENGLYNSKLNRIEIPSGNTNSSTNTASNNDLILAAALNRNSDILEKLEAEGVIAYVSNKDLKSMGNLKKGIKDYEDLINKTKK